MIKSYGCEVYSCDPCNHEEGDRPERKERGRLELDPCFYQSLDHCNYHHVKWQRNRDCCDSVELS